MTEPILDASRVVASIGQGVAAAVPQHVGMDRKGEASALADALISRLAASRVNEPPRSVAKTKAEAGECRRSSHSACTSSPRSG